MHGDLPRPNKNGPLNRAIRAGGLLPTRVDVGRSAQNQKLLASMDRRADLTLRVQHTVEGLSVVAASYYSVSRVNFFLTPFAVSIIVSKSTLTTLAKAPVIMPVWFLIRSIHQKIRT